MVMQSSSGIYLKGGSFGGFSATHRYQKRHFNSATSQNNVISGFPSSDQVASKKIRPSAELQDKDDNSEEETSLLGLRLRKTPSLINLLETRLSQKNKTADQEFARAKMESEKLKASNFPAALLRIGVWEVISAHEGDLVAKCYYAKKKIVWEVLMGALKSKIEIQWSDIIGIRAIIRPNEPGILEIELDHAPSFHRETNPQPRKHTLWNQSTDFTGGEARHYRRHYLVFRPGNLDKHYEKLLQCDQRLYELSKKPFPTLSDPHFKQTMFSYAGYSGNSNGTEIAPQMQYNVPTLRFPAVNIPPAHVQNFQPTTSPALGVVDSTSPLSVLNVPQPVENQSMLWNQGVNSFLGRCPMAIARQVSPADFYQMNTGEDSGIATPSSGMSISDIENLLEESFPGLEEFNQNTNDPTVNQMMCEHEILGTNEFVPDSVGYCGANGAIVTSNVVAPMPTQDSNVSMNMTPTNDQAIPFGFSEQKLQGPAALDASHWA